MTYNDDLDIETDDGEPYNTMFESDDTEAFVPTSRYRAIPTRRTIVNRSPLQFSPAGVNGGGIKTANLNTPKGRAEIQMTEAVATHEQFKQTTQQTQLAIARTARRINDIEGDVQVLGQRVDAVETGTRTGLMKLSREHKTAVARIRKEQKSKEMMNLMLFFLTQQDVQKQLASHTHAANNQVPVGSTETAKPLSNSNDNLLLFLLLPSLLSSSEGGGDDSFGGGLGALPFLLLFNK
jgi:hypothetical protein